MAHFSDTYFQEEVREGFKIESMMKRAWAAQIEVLEEIDRICNKYNLTYYADWGTLLGAVRHGGFIPWDDDIDIAMDRPSYMRFMEVGGKELTNHCKILSMYTEKLYSEAFMRVVNSESICFDRKHLERYHGCPYVVGVDIFPLDRFTVDADQRMIHTGLLNMIYTAIQNLNAGENMDEMIGQIERLCQIKIKNEDNIKNQLLRLMDTICQLYSNGTGNLTEYANNFGNRVYEFLPEWYEQRVWIPFETIQIPVPKEYDNVLTEMYGDYRIPVFNGAGHEYPFYRQQEEIVDKYIHTFHE